MANTLNLGTDGNWATKEDSLLAYNSENGNFKPLPFDFTRASSATVVNKAGLIETVGSGEPRIDFLGNTKGALLLEPTRSNLITNSEDFSNSSWLKVGGAITSNIGVSPDGGLNADRFYIANAVANTRLYISYTFSSSTYTLSVYAKNNGSTDSFRFSYYDGVSQEFSNDFSLTNEWQRFTHTFTAAAGAGAGVVWIATTSSIGVGSELDIQIYGAQLEQGSYATSIIPTQGSAVTRVADASSQTVPSGIIGQTEGTMFLDSKMALQSVNNYQLFSINNGGGSDRIRILTAIGNRLRFIYQLDGGALAYSFYNPTDYSDLTNLKIAFTYKSGDIKVYINGVLVDSSTNTFTIAQTLTNIDIATSSGGYNQMLFNDIKLYNTALTDQELINLTTL